MHPQLQLHPSPTNISPKGRFPSPRECPFSPLGSSFHSLGYALLPIGRFFSLPVEPPFSLSKFCSSRETLPKEHLSPRWDVPSTPQGNLPQGMPLLPIGMSFQLPKGTPPLGICTKEILLPPQGHLLVAKH